MHAGEVEAHDILPLMRGAVSFLSYNNAVPIAFSILLMGAGGAFAATNPEVFYATTEKVISVDNRYIAQTDLTSYTPHVQVLGVTEDTDTYYVAYALTTIDVVDAVWMDVVKQDVLKVSKSVLGEYGDLGLYTSEQLKQRIDHEIAYLREVQEIERREVTAKVVATEYSGLVGRFLDASSETFPGYVPVVEPKIVDVQTNTQDGVLQAAAAAGASQVPVPGEPPTIQVLGPNPLHIAVGSDFVDLGVVVSDNSGDIATFKRYLDDVEVQTDILSIDTTEAREWRIRYVATDTDGNVSEAERLVIVGGGTTPASLKESPLPIDTPMDAVPEPSALDIPVEASPQEASLPADTSENPVQNPSVQSTPIETPPQEESISESSATTSDSL